MTVRAPRRQFLSIVGTTVVLVGVVLIFVPVPVFVVIPAESAILATEFVWARASLKRSKREIGGLASRARERDQRFLSHDSISSDRRNPMPMADDSSFAYA